MMMSCARARADQDRGHVRHGCTHAQNLTQTQSNHVAERDARAKRLFYESRSSSHHGDPCARTHQIRELLENYTLFFVIKQYCLISCVSCVFEGFREWHLNTPISRALGDKVHGHEVY